MSPDYWDGFLAGIRYYHNLLKTRGVPRDKEGVPIFFPEEPKVDRKDEDD